jgi:hypothetical protein
MGRLLDFDLLAPLTLIDRIAGIFLPPARRVIDFAIAVGKKVLEFIFEGVMLIAGPMGARIVAIVSKIGDSFNKIVADPVGFAGNLVQAVKLGFNQFSKNIVEHLKVGLIEWLVGALEGAGLVLPKVWDLKGLLSFVLQVLGITYAKIRQKLVKVLGEKTVGMLEKTFEFIRALVTEGPAAAWQKIVQAIGSFWDMVIGGIKDWAITKIVTAAVVKIASMLNPVGAVIEAIIDIYHTIAFFVERMNQILALVEAIVDSIANIVAGKLGAAANYVENVMARTIPVILGFLASIIGLGDVSAAIEKVVAGIQQKVDEGIDIAIAWIVEQAKALFGDKAEVGDEKWEAAVAGVGADVDAMPEEERNEFGFNQRLEGWKSQYEFTELSVEHSGGELIIEGAMSPKKEVKKVKDNAVIAKELEGEEWIQVKRSSGGWLVGELKGLDVEKTEIYYTVTFPVSPTMKGIAKFTEYDKLVRKYIPGTEGYLSPEALASANATNYWEMNFELAKKVLNYRANDDDDQSHNPPGKQWHHIHEQSGDGPSSVENLALTSATNNQKFAIWFGKPQSRIGSLEASGDKPLRTYLKEKSNPDLWKEWGHACLSAMHVSVEPGTPDTKGPWNQIPQDASE